MEKTLDQISDEHCLKLADLAGFADFTEQDVKIQMGRDIALNKASVFVGEPFLQNYVQVINFLLAEGYHIPELNAYPSQPERVEGGDDLKGYIANRMKHFEEMSQKVEFDPNLKMVYVAKWELCQEILTAAPSAVDWDEVEKEVYTSCFTEAASDAARQIVAYLKNTLTAKD